jgi:hypothetical protein
MKLRFNVLLLITLSWKCEFNTLEFLWGGHLARPVNEAEPLHRLLNSCSLTNQRRAIA